jgi:hypothetical protein
MGEVKPDETAEEFEAIYRRHDVAVSEVLVAVVGAIPDWVPAPHVTDAQRVVHGLLFDLFKPEDTLRLVAENILRLVVEAEQGRLTIPGVVTDSAAFVGKIDVLVRMRHAISRGPVEGGRMLGVDVRAEKQGRLFLAGRKVNTGGPIRKAIAQLLAKYPGMKNADLWGRIKAKPPKGWQVFDNPRGKYIEGPRMANMIYARFCTVCSEERKKVKAKITG